MQSLGHASTLARCVSDLMPGATSHTDTAHFTDQTELAPGPSQSVGSLRLGNGSDLGLGKGTMIRRRLIAASACDAIAGAR
jgi:hypothetical protein